MRSDATIARAEHGLAAVSPPAAPQPLPGERLLHAVATSRKYGQRVRWRRFPPIVAMFRSCGDAL